MNYEEYKKSFFIVQIALCNIGMLDTIGAWFLDASQALEAVFFRPWNSPTAILPRRRSPNWQTYRDNLSVTDI